MNDAQDDRPPDGQPPLLPYRSGIDERASRPRVPVWLQVLLGFLGSCAALVVAAVIGAFGSGCGSIIMLMFALITLAALGFGLREDPRCRGWPIGIWLGIGATALTAGLCFMALANA